MKNLAVITARSGSKGLKDKNIRLLNGEPLLAYSIEAARKSGQFAEIFVSTDSALYAQIAREWGASVPFLRCEELSTDTASSWDVVRDTVLRYREMGEEFDTVALLQPTSPIRTANDIIAGYKEMKEKNANAIVSVCEVDHSPLWSNILPEDLSLKDFIKEDIIKRQRQSLQTYYRINGALYIVKTDYLMSTDNIYSSRIYALIMAKKHSVDIDDEVDFICAEALVKHLEQKEDLS